MTTPNEQIDRVIITVIPQDGYAGRVDFTCPNNRDHKCYVPVREGTQRGLAWGWDGNVEAPTLTPSIDCKQCGWHGFIVNGVTQS